MHWSHQQYPNAKREADANDFVTTREVHGASSVYPPRAAARRVGIRPHRISRPHSEKDLGQAHIRPPIRKDLGSTGARPMPTRLGMPPAHPGAGLPQAALALASSPGYDSRQFLYTE